MFHVGGIWTNGLRRTSSETDVYSNTMRFKLAPDVSRIHIQLTLSGRSRCWAVTAVKNVPTWRLECEFHINAWMREYFKGNTWKFQSCWNITGVTFVWAYKSTFIVSLQVLVTAVRCAAWGPLVVVILFIPEHNSPLAGCFYTKCLKGSCVHTFLTCAGGIALNPYSVSACSTHRFTQSNSSSQEMHLKACSSCCK